MIPFFKYTAYPEPETIPTSHDFCKSHAGKIYHISEIKKFPTKGKGFIDGSNYFKDFNDNISNFSIDQQLYNCRHYFIRVSSMDEVPKNKWHMLNVSYSGELKDLKKFCVKELKLDEENQSSGIQAISFVETPAIETNFEYFSKDGKIEIPDEDMFFKFEIANKLKKQVKGLVLKSHQMIFRQDADGQGNPGYVFMTADTVRKLKEKYGYNRKITFQHREDITGNAILLDSWIDEPDMETDTNDQITRWFMKYQIIGDALWAQIESGKVKGFSIEGIFKIN